MHSSRPPRGLLWVYLLWLGSCNWAICPLVHSLPCPVIHLRGCIEDVPLNVEVSSAQQTYDVVSRVHFTPYFPENSIQTEHNVQTDTQANLCIPDASWPSICQQTKVLVPPWKSVPGGSSATPKWDRLIGTTLGCAICCAWWSHPR